LTSALLIFQYFTMPSLRAV